VSFAIAVVGVVVVVMAQAFLYFAEKR